MKYVITFLFALMVSVGGTAVMAASHPTPPVPAPVEEHYPGGGPIPDCEPICDSEDVDAVEEDDEPDEPDEPSPPE